MTLKRTAISIAIAAGCGFAGLAWAAPSQTVLELFNRLPEPPATAEEAAKWAAKDGTIVHPGLVALRADIETHRRSVQAIAQAREPAARAQASAQIDAMGKGMATAGIDMARMQRDPAYAREVQASMQRMSPQEAMAMSQAMARAMSQDRRIQNQAQAMVDDSPPVRAAAAAGAEFGNQQVARIQDHVARWRETESAVGRIEATTLRVTVTHPRIEFDNPGCDGACQAQWHGYAAAMLPLLIDRDTQALRLRREALQRERAGWNPIVADANKHLLATDYGATAKAQVHQAYIGGYDEGVLGDIGMLLDKTEEIVRRASRSVHCGEKAVLVPGAVCR
jgi:hypothetical protein